MSAAEHVYKLTKILKRPPDAINEIGNAFWKEESLTKHAELKLGKGWRVLAVENKETGEAGRILVDPKSGEVVHGTQKMEAMYIHIDVTAFAGTYKKAKVTKTPTKPHEQKTHIRHAGLLRQGVPLRRE